MTVVLIIYVLMWLVIPIFGHWFTHVTTKPLLKVSNEVRGFWDFVAGDKNNTVGAHALMFDGKDLVDSWSARWGDTEPPKGDWK
jgi:hypothetical protein